ncbi:MAG: S8 family serine peptidase [Candidatus Dormibacteria bacterium]
MPELHVNRRLRRPLAGSRAPRRARVPLFGLGLTTLATGLLALPVLAAATSFPNDYFFATNQQWALTGAPASINAPAAWCVSTGAGMVIADVDSGADFGHPDLAGKLIPGANFTNGDGSLKATGQAAVQDDYGHGTITSGVAAADTNNNQGIAGAAPDARVLVVKVLDSSGNGTAADVGAGIRWAADHGANVINVSIGSGPGTVNKVMATADTSIPDAVNYAASRGVGVAVAAGNTSDSFSDYQVSQIDQVALVVGAVNHDGALASYSTQGRGVNLYGPGGDGPADSQHQVISTYWQAGHPGTYAIAAGTSLSTPMAAAGLALLMAQGMTAQQAHDRLIATSTDRGHGYRVIDLAAAIGASGTCGQRSSTSAGPPPTTVAPPSRSGSGVRPSGTNAAPAAKPQTSPSPSPAEVPTPSPAELALTPVSPEPSLPPGRRGGAAPAAVSHPPRLPDWAFPVRALAMFGAGTAVYVFARTR